MIKKTTHEDMRQMAFDSIPRKSFVIEVGCSSGNFAELMRNTEHRYIGVDIQQNKINEAKIKFPEMDFRCCDITKNLNILKQATVVVSFQCLEHIKEDLAVMKAVPFGANMFISVPNRTYKGHVRWYELEGWRERFKQYMQFKEIITIQHPVKKNNRAFLFKGIRNNESN